MKVVCNTFFSAASLPSGSRWSLKCTHWNGILLFHKILLNVYFQSTKWMYSGVYHLTTHWCVQYTYINKYVIILQLAGVYSIHTYINKYMIIFPFEGAMAFHLNKKLEFSSPKDTCNLYQVVSSLIQISPVVRYSCIWACKTMIP